MPVETPVIKTSRARVFAMPRRGPLLTYQSTILLTSWSVIIEGRELLSRSTPGWCAMGVDEAAGACQRLAHGGGLAPDLANDGRALGERGDRPGERPGVGGGV